MSGTELVYSGICLRVPGTGRAYSGIYSLFACYATPGTEVVHGGICLRVRYAMSGTEIAHGATR
eukprot:3529425-Rhodomonas_salina.1